MQELTDHEAAISTIAYSRDGAYLISASDDGEIIIRDGITGAAEQRLRKHQGVVTALALDRTGSGLISAGDDPLLVAWDIDSGEELAAVSAADGGDIEIYDLVLSADGERVIGWSNSGAKTVMAQWSADTLELLTADTGGRVYRGHDKHGRIGYSGGRSLPAFPGDGNTGDLVLWDLATGQQLAHLSEGFNWSFLSSGSLATATDELLFITFYEDVALVVVDNGESGRRAALVNVEDGRVLRSFDTEITTQLTSAEFLDMETIVSATSDNRVVVWSSGDGGLIREIGSASQAIEQLHVNAAANLVIAQTSAGRAHLWRISDEEPEPLLNLTEALPGTSISPNGAVLLLVEEDGVSLTEVDSMEVLVQHPRSQISSAGARFAAYVDDRVSIYDMETGAEIRGWDWDEYAVVDLHLSPDGHLLLVVSESKELWLARPDGDSPQRLARLVERPSLVRFAPGGETVLSLQDELAVLWDPESGLARGAYPLGVTASVAVQAAFSQSGDSIVFYVQLEDGLAGLTTLDLAEDGVRRQTFVDVKTAALSTDGEYLSLAFSDGRIHVIATASGQVLGQLPAHPGEAKKLHFLPEADTLITAAGSELNLWDLSAGVVDQRFAHSSPIADFSLSRDGERILTADESGAYRLWQVESAEKLLARIATTHAPRDLTCAEREQHLVAPLCE